MEIQIRPAAKKDCSGITTMTNLLGYPSSEDKVCQILEMVLKHPDHQIFIADADNQVAGYIHLVCTMRMGSEPYVEIAALFVHEDFQSKGIGSALIHEAIKWTQAKDHKIIRIRSNIIRKKAHMFFMRNGFENLKTQEVFLKKL
jgi:GNAT superfamily N-acetyltransferase